MRALVIALALTVTTAMAVEVWRWGLLAALYLRAPPEHAVVAAAPLPADRPARILVIGTSLTATGDWPDRLAARLAACRSGDVEAVRLAQSGANSAWGAAAIEPALAALADEGRLPDAAIVEFAINDSSYFRGVPLAAARANQDAILDALAALDSPPAVVVATMNPPWGRPAWERPGFRGYVAAAVKDAAARGVGVVDTLPAWRALPEDRRQALAPDGLHPTPEAMAEILTPTLAAALRPHFCPEAGAASTRP